MFFFRYRLLSSRLNRAVGLGLKVPIYIIIILISRTHLRFVLVCIIELYNSKSILSLSRRGTFFILSRYAIFRLSCSLQFLLLFSLQRQYLLLLSMFASIWLIVIHLFLEAMIRDYFALYSAKRYLFLSFKLFMIVSCTHLHFTINIFPLSLLCSPLP